MSRPRRCSGPTASRSPRGAGSTPKSLALDGSLVYVGIERVNQVLRFDFAKGFTRALGEVVPLPPAARKLPYNRGIEALVDGAEGPAPGGNADRDLERGLDAQGNIRSLPDRRQNARRRSAIRRTDNFDISDAVLLPSGELLLLERNFPGSAGSASASAVFALASIGPGAVIDGPSIFSADLGDEID